MNKTSIEWADMTCNPLSGCRHACRNDYCYNTMKNSAPLNRFGARYRDEYGKIIRVKDWRSRETGGLHVAAKGEIYPYGYDCTFYPGRLDEPRRRKKPTKIFMVDVGDLFGQWVPAEWIQSILDVARECKQHTFIFLTKNPVRYQKFTFPTNAWAGTSVNTAADWKRVELMKQVDAPVRFLSIEPLLGPLNRIDFRGLQWLVLGAMTGRNALVPSREWVDDIVCKAKGLGIPVFIKDNLQVHCEYAYREYPHMTEDPAQKALFPK